MRRANSPPSDWRNRSCRAGRAEWISKKPGSGINSSRHLHGTMMPVYPFVHPRRKPSSSRPPGAILKHPLVTPKTSEPVNTLVDSSAHSRIAQQLSSASPLQALHYARNTAWTLTERIARLATTLLLTVILARYLGAAGFGLLSYASSLAAIAAVMVSLGLEQVLIREIVRQPEAVPALIGTALYLRLVVAIALTSCAGRCHHAHGRGSGLAQCHHVDYGNPAVSGL